MSKEEDKDDGHSVFGFVMYVDSITSLVLSTLHGNHPSHGHSTTSPFPGNPVLPVTSSSGRNRWLYDTGVSDHITNDLSQFDMYKECGGLPIMKTANGPVRPLGVGTVTLDCPRSNGTINMLKLFDVVYMPQSPLNLLSGLRLMARGGYTRDSKLLLKDDQEFGQIDSSLLLIENPRYLVFVLPAAIEKAPVNIELWYYCLGYLNFDTIKATQGIVKGLIY